MLNSTAGSKRLHAETDEDDAGDLRDPFDGSPGNFLVFLPLCVSINCAHVLTLLMQLATALVRVRLEQVE